MHTPDGSSLARIDPRQYLTSPPIAYQPIIPLPDADHSDLTPDVHMHVHPALQLPVPVAMLNRN
jgi:hypothetical protein